MEMVLNRIEIPTLKDPRWIALACLGSYLILGFTLLGFNRTPSQAIMTSVVCAVMEMGFHLIFKKKWIFPLSAFITSISLSILLNYSHDFWLLLVPVYFAIGSKYIFTFKGKHNYNPAQVAVTFSLLFCGELITSSPAYQWYGMESISVLIVFLGVFFILPQVNKMPLVISFLGFYTLQTLFRAWLMQHHLPFQTLFLGSISSPPFFLFTFFMITDPATSPGPRKEQIKAGFWLAFLDLIFHIRQSYYTFFYAGFTLQSYKLVKNHIQALRSAPSSKAYFKESFVESGYWKRLVVLGGMGILGVFTYKTIIYPTLPKQNLPFHMTAISSDHSGLKSNLSNTLYRTDERLHHIIKWVLSVGDSVAVGDFDNDGLMDIFLTNVLKQDDERASLYRNLGDFKFEKVTLPALGDRFARIEENGLPSNGLFVDYDNDGDMDLFIMVAFGEPVVLKNLLSETGKADFVDVTHELGLGDYANGLAVNFADLNRSGRLDLIVGHVWPTHLPDYPKDKPQRLNVFNLPQEEFKDDKRMFNFMHSSWHLSDNGGVNIIYEQQNDGRFKKLDSLKIGIPETFWTLAIGTADVDQDGWIDLYMANDFGPDNFYLNQKNMTFKKIEGSFFGDLGRDTYKGMNASVEDVDNNGYPDVYVSNVHHEMQAEGSLFWFFDKENGKLTFKDRATEMGALNESRFGWGASFADFNNDGFLDLVQANGMVDDMPDKKFDECKDYWYTNEKIARSPPEIHRFIHFWGDIRGYCIYPQELNRFYLNTGRTDKQMYADVATSVGLDQRKNSRGVASADFNNDGLMDLIITNQFREADLYKNEWVSNDKRNQWIGFDLVSKNKKCNSMALGSQLKLTYTNNKNQLKTVYKEMKLANGFSAQNESRAHFGLGPEIKGPLNVEINWCQNKKINYQFSDLDRYHQVVFQ
jgi:enediyne biosynthesis protein E4